jgi:hypothetical protein
MTIQMHALVTGRFKRVSVCILLLPVLLIGIYVFFNQLHIARFAAYFPPSHYVLGAQTFAVEKSNSIYFGEGVDMSQLLPGSSRYVKNSHGEDLIDLSAKLGITMLRITNATPPVDNNEAIYTQAEWNTVLDKMQSKGIKAIILIENPTIHQKYIPSTYLPFVQRYIIDSNVLSHPAVYGVDLYNEVAINSATNVGILQTAAQRIKRSYPNTRITLGWWAIDTFKKDEEGKPVYKWDDYAAGRKANNFIDFYSIHMYGFDQKIFGVYPDPYLYTKGFLSDVKNGLHTNKPLLIEEFGAANGEAVSDQETLGSKQLQATVYQGVYTALIDQHDPQILGAIAYQFNTRLSGPDAWAILSNNGDTLFPAAYILQKYATGVADIPIGVPYTNIPEDYLLTNKDNTSQITLKLDDIVGFNLVLDPSKQYTISTTGDSILKQTQNLMNYWGENHYYAVYHATAVGTAVISIKQDDNEEVYKVTITVQ